MTENQFQVGLLQVGLLLDKLPDSVLLIDSKGIICYANQRSQEQLHTTDLSGTSFRDLIDKRDLERFPEHPQDWINWQNSDDSSWELRLATEENSQLVSGKASLVSLPTRSSTIFEGVLVVLRLVRLPNQTVSRKLLDAQTHAQERIARDLHDSVQQRINVISGIAQIMHMKLGNQLSPEIDRLLTKLFESSRQAAAEIRAIAHRLNSIGSARDGLMRALQQLATTTQEILKTNCVVTYEQPVLIDDHEKENHLYRIATLTLRSPLTIEDSVPSLPVPSPAKMLHQNSAEHTRTSSRPRHSFTRN